MIDAGGPANNQSLPIQSREISPGTTKDAISGRFVHTFLEVGKDFTTWIKYQIRRAKLLEGHDFCVVRGLPPQGGKPDSNQGGRPSVDYCLTIECAERIGMMSETDRGDEIRRKFQAYRDELVSIKNQPVDFRAIVSDPSLSRQLLVAALEETQSLRAVVAAQLPKIQALEQITATKDSVCIRLAAKILGMGPYALRDKLIEIKWVYRGAKGRLTAYQPIIDRGVMEHRYWTPEGKDPAESTKAQPLVTTKGIAELKLLLSQTAIIGGSEA